MGYLLQAGPLARARPLVIVGHYERTSGGCDTIPNSHGGMEEVFAIASRYARRGWNVFLEGNELSREYRKSLDLARRHPLHILLLITPVEECVRRLARRRSLLRQQLTRLYHQLEEQARSIRQTCNLLRSVADVDQLDFDEGITRAEQLLGIPEITA